MTLQEKIIKLRKKNGWSQEELADKLYVTRQAVSKWESGQSLPDVEKIVHMSKLFRVTTDYLLNDEIGTEDIIEESVADDKKILEKADVDAYFEAEKVKSKYRAAAAGLMAISPLVYVILKMCSVENSALIGGIVAAVFLSLVVALFCVSDNKVSEFKHIITGSFTLGYGVRTYVMQLRSEFRKKRQRVTFPVIALLMLDVLMLVLLMLIYKDPNPMVTNIAVTVSLVILSICAPISILFSDMLHPANRLLKSGSYAPENLAINKKISLSKSIIFSCALIGGCTYGFITEDWTKCFLVCATSCTFLCLIVEKIIKYVHELNKDKKQSKDIETK